MAVEGRFIESRLSPLKAAGTGAQIKKTGDAISLGQIFISRPPCLIYKVSLDSRQRGVRQARERRDIEEGWKVDCQ